MLTVTMSFFLDQVDRTKFTLQHSRRQVWGLASPEPWPQLRTGGAAGEALLYAYLALHNGEEHRAERAAALLARG
jgi:hypothetical protein